MGQTVYVLNRHGEPLMPCSPRKARLLLKEGKAKVKRRTPFTIQLCRRWQQDHRPERVHRGERVVRCGMHTPE